MSFRSLILNIITYSKFPLYLPIFICYLCSKDKRRLINEDISAIHKFNTGCESNNYIRLFIQLFSNYKEFRSQVYFRLKPWSFIFKTLPGQQNLSFNIPQNKLKGGLYIHHGFATTICARSIGKNFSIHHNSSIVHGKGGLPEIGDNVFVGTGAVIMGKITIGDNVFIGANATVFKDVPSNCTVVGSKSYIVKQNGCKVHIEL